MFFLGSLGRYALHKLASLGRSTLMFCHSVFTLPRAKTFPLFINQVYFIGVQSIIIILVSGLFIGMVLGLQGYNILKDFMATGSWNLSCTCYYPRVRPCGGSLIICWSSRFSSDS